MSRGAILFLPFVAFVLLAGILAFRAGTWQANLSETDIINNYAAKYVAETGGQPTDCAATPGQGEVWIAVTCTPANGAPHIFPVNKRGALVPLTELQEAI